VTPPVTSRTAVLLGAQRFEPTLGSVVKKLGIDGRIALITAGWQEREQEDEELSEHLGGRTVNLQLHQRGGAIFRSDKVIQAAHRERQTLLRHLQEIYRIRLQHAFEAERDVATYDTPAAIKEEVSASSVEAIRSLDAWHIGHCENVRADFESKVNVLERPEVARHRDDIKRMLADCSAVAIAGGHIAVLLNRLVMFGMAELIGDRPVFAWSAGAMAISERIVLFHDDPPDGRVARQVLDLGLGFVPNTVVLPEPERRLDLREGARVSVLAKRFAPARCLAFPARSFLIWNGSSISDASGVIELRKDGEHVPFVPGSTTT
jgi:hypothetical protein